MNNSRLLTIVLTFSLIASLIYNFVLFRQSEAAIFRGADGQITAVSGLVSDISALASKKIFQLEESDTGATFDIAVNENTKVRFLTDSNEFIDIDFNVIAPGDNVFVKFGQGGVNGAADTIDILPPEVN